MLCVMVFRAGHNRDMTDTGNRARKTSGTQGIVVLVHFSNRSQCEYNFPLMQYFRFSQIPSTGLLAVSKNYRHAWSLWPIHSHMYSDTILQDDCIPKEE